MPTFLIDPDLAAADLRARLYGGDLVLYTQVPAVEDLVEWTRRELAALFAPHDPEEAHLHFSPEEMAPLLAEWKPRFMRLARSKELLERVVSEVGLTLSETYLDLLKARTAFPVGHLTTGIAFAFPWHRDTWYAAPAQQINWWLPVYDISDTNSMKFDTGSFSTAVANSSDTFDYYRINQDRRRTAEQITTEVQARPAAFGHEPSDPLIVLGRPGSVLLFSGAQLHASIPNQSGRSRYSIDFRTVDHDDVVSGRGAPLIDVHCTGTSLRDFLHPATGEPLEEDLIRKLHGDPPPGAMLTFSG